MITIRKLFSCAHGVTQLKKRLKCIMLVSMLLIMDNPMYTFAQKSPWIFGLHTRSNSVITNDVLGLADILVNTAITSLTEGAVPTELSFIDYHYVSVKDNGEPLKYQRNNPYGFTSYDLFNDLEVGLKFGWQGAESPIGFYVYGAYGINQYKLRFIGEQDYNKHKLQNLRLGVGIRISPLNFLLEEYEWCPIVDIGTTYVNNFSYKGPYGNDKNQINNGLRSYYGIGALFGERGTVSVMLCLDMANYDIFNKDYTPDNGFWYPYANFKSTDLNVSLKLGINLVWDD